MKYFRKSHLYLQWFCEKEVKKSIYEKPHYMSHSMALLLLQIV